jgi:hypothetical protein
MYSIFQNFNVKRVHNNNGPAFKNKGWLNLMAALNAKIVNSSANDPQAGGKAERTIQLDKTTMEKNFWQQHLQALLTENTYQ